MRRMLRPAWLVLLLAALPLPALAQGGSFVETLGGDPPSPEARTTASRYEALVAGGDRAALKAFLVAMPKGADLHNHYSGSLHAETYLELARAQQDEFKIDKESLAFVPKRSWGQKALWTIDEVFADPALHARVIQAWSIEGYQPSPDGPTPDQDFFQAFLGFGAFAKASLPQGLKVLRERALGEHVLYLECMLMPGPYWYTSADADRRLLEAADEAALEQELTRLADQFAADPKFEQAVRLYLEEVRKNHEGIDTSRFMMRYVAYADRNGAPANCFGRLMASFAAAAAEPLIVGVNLVGAENGAVALRDYRLQMRMIRFLSRRYPDVPVALHAGELVPAMGSEEDLSFHVRDAVEVAGARRVGHAVDAPREADAEALLALLKERRVAVEINLTSNEFILGVRGDDHPFQLFRERGVPMVISTDDAGVARTDGLSHEFLLLAERHRVPYPELKQLALNSIGYAFLPEDTRRSLARRLKAQFRSFERRVAASHN